MSRSVCLIPNGAHEVTNINFIYLFFNLRGGGWVGRGGGGRSHSLLGNSCYIFIVTNSFMLFIEASKM